MSIDISLHRLRSLFDHAVDIYIVLIFPYVSPCAYVISNMSRINSLETGSEMKSCV